MTRPQAHKLIAAVQRRRHPRQVIEQLGVAPAEARAILVDAGQSDAVLDVDRMLRGRG